MIFKKRAIYFLMILAFFSSCTDNKTNNEVKLSKIYVTYFPSSQNYDFDSVQISNRHSFHIDTLFVAYNADLKYEHADRYETQKLTLTKSKVYKNVAYNGANKPFVWAESQVNNFEVSIDSLRRYLKMVILNKNNFSIYSKEKGYQKIVLTDTSKIILKELYGGL